MKKSRFLSTFLALCLVASLLPTLEQSAHAAMTTTRFDIDGEVYWEPAGTYGDCSGTNWEYDADSATLTLRGATIDSTSLLELDYYAVNSNGDLTIILEEGTVNTIVADPDEESRSTYGIYTSGDLTITGGGTLNVSAGRSTSTNIPIFCSYNLTISGCTVNAEATVDAGEGSAGIIAYGAMTIEDSVVTAKAAGGSQMSFGILSAASLTIENSTVTATGSAAAASLGVASPEGVTMESGTLNATGGTSPDMSYALSDGSVTVSGGTMNLRYDTNASDAGACGAITNNGATPLYFTGAQMNGAALETLASGETTTDAVTAPSGSMGVSYNAPPTDPDPETPSDDPMRGNVYGQYVDGDTIEVISVDIEWGSMRFAYSASGMQTWNPDEHDYGEDTGEGWYALDPNGDLITITNHSNVDVEVTPSAVSAKNTVTGIEFMVEGTGINYATDYVLQAGQENQYENADYLMLAVVPQGTLQNTDTDIDKIADITITIEKYE